MTGNSSDNSGLYILPIRLEAPAHITVGALGEIAFLPGGYLYTGSARRGLRHPQISPPPDIRGHPLSAGPRSGYNGAWRISSSISLRGDPWPAFPSLDETGQTVKTGQITKQTQWGASLRGARLCGPFS